MYIVVLYGEMNNINIAHSFEIALNINFYVLNF